MVTKVVYRIRRSTFVEDPGWVVYWEELPHCTYMTTPQYFECPTREYDLSICFPESAYITKAALDSLTAEEYNSISGRVIDVVTTPYAYQTGPHFDKIAFNYYCWRFDANSLFDPCKDVTCENICKEYDRWSQKCVEGSCVDGALVEQNSPACGYVPPDPCEGITCDPVCHEYELWLQKCVDGSCVDDTMIEQNSSTCGYIPPDPCEGITCEDACVGYDLWSQYCVDGLCVKDTILESNSPTCGYVPPDEPDWYDPIVDNCGYIFLLIVGGVAIDHMLE